MDPYGKEDFVLSLEIAKVGFIFRFTKFLILFTLMKRQISVSDKVTCFKVQLYILYYLILSILN